MVFLVFLVNTLASYASVIKSRLILSKFSEQRSFFKRTFYVLVDILLSLFLFLLSFQIAETFHQLSDAFVNRNLGVIFIDLPYETPHDFGLAPKTSEVYFRFLLPMSMYVLAPIAWVVMFALGAFVAKALIYLETLRRFAVAHFAVDKHPLLVTSWCIVAVLIFAFWIPVGLYALTIR
jgi:hypothetical protein